MLHMRACAVGYTIPHVSWHTGMRADALRQWGQCEVQIQVDGGRAEPIQRKSCLIPLAHGFELEQACFRCGIPVTVEPSAWKENLAAIWFCLHFQKTWTLAGDLGISSGTPSLRSFSGHHSARHRSDLLAGPCAAAAAAHWVRVQQPRSRRVGCLLADPR
jgi:hypothetical protein